MITIEPLVPDQFQLVAEWLSQPEINRWLSGEWRGRTVTSVTVAIAVRNRKNLLFLVRHGKRPCGLAALADIDAADATAMVWYLLGDSTLAGRGITSRAVRQLARLAFRELKLASVYAWAMEDNIASVRVLRKAGFHQVGSIRCAASYNGRQVDRVYFDLISSECDAA
jgi:RimJ/RimL family protein N-acetyltransferase